MGLLKSLEHRRAVSLLFRFLLRAGLDRGRVATAGELSHLSTPAVVSVSSCCCTFLGRPCRALPRLSLRSSDFPHTFRRAAARRPHKRTILYLINAFPVKLFMIPPVSEALSGKATPPLLSRCHNKVVTEGVPLSPASLPRGRCHNEVVTEGVIYLNKDDSAAVFTFHTPRRCGFVHIRRRSCMLQPPQRSS